MTEKPVASNARAHARAQGYNRNLPPIDIADAAAEPPEDRVFRMPEATLPEPPKPQAPSPKPQAEKPARPTTLDEAYPWLLKPFKQADVEILAAATTGDKSRALCVPYADPRVYFARLDQIVGPASWSTELVMGDRGVVCKLTIFGVSRSASGDYDLKGENAVTSAEAQAFKRACAAFGLGRYLYNLPQTWAPYDEKRKAVIDPQAVVRQMYASLAE